MKWLSKTVSNHLYLPTDNVFRTFQSQLLSCKNNRQHGLGSLRNYAASYFIRYYL